jgi:hypothetical protein
LKPHALSSPQPTNHTSPSPAESTTTTTTTNNNNKPTSNERHTSTNEPVDSGYPRVEMLKNAKLEDFIISRTLGTGSFGRVHLVQYRPTGAYYAMKVLKKSEVVRLKQVEHIVNEKTILERTHHPYLVNLMATFQDSVNLYMVLEYVVGGEMFTYLRKFQASKLYFGEYYLY